MYEIYSETIKVLGYSQEFDAKDFQNLELDELSGFIAQGISEISSQEFSQKCDRIIVSIGGV